MIKEKFESIFGKVDWSNPETLESFAVFVLGYESGKLDEMLSDLEVLKQSKSEPAKKWNPPPVKWENEVSE